MLSETRAGEEVLEEGKAHAANHSLVRHDTCMHAAVIKVNYTVTLAPYFIVLLERCALPH